MYGRSNGLSIIVNLEISKEVVRVRAVANGPVGPAMAGPIIEPVI